MVTTPGSSGPSWLETSAVTGSNARLDDAGRAVAAGDLVLQEHEAVEHGLGAGRAAGDVDVAADDLVDAGDGRVVVVEAARAGAGAEREDPLRVHHLLVDAAQHGRLALADGADHPEEVGLARREARGLGAEAGQSKRGLASDMNSMPQHAVTKGYWKSEYFCAQLSSASKRVVAKPASWR